MFRSTIQDPKVLGVIQRLVEERRQPPVGGVPGNAHDFAQYGFSVSPEQGDLIYLLCRAIGAKRVVDFATSVGMSTLYFAAAVRDNGGGMVIGSELVPEKVITAKRNLGEAGLWEYTDIRWNMFATPPMVFLPSPCRSSAGRNFARRLRNFQRRATGVAPLRSQPTARTTTRRITRNRTLVIFEWRAELRYTRRCGKMMFNEVQPWEDMVKSLGFLDRMIVLIKPFDAIEVQQLAVGLSEKWRLYQQGKLRVDNLEKLVQSLRSR
jgi:hypothetical protein